MLAGAIKRMRHRQLSMAFEKWQFEAAALARKKFLLAGAVKRMLHRKLSMAFEKWQVVAPSPKPYSLSSLALSHLAVRD